MLSHALKKTVLLFAVILGVVSVSFSFAVWHHEDPNSRIQFSLVNQDGLTITEKDLGGKHLLVFFGFTSCPDVCPTELSKISRVMTAFNESGDAHSLTPVFISVDPERDSPERIKQYLAYFDESFVGLTGTRAALKRTTDEFNTLLQEAPTATDENYLVTHSSLVYVVDPFSRVIDHIPFNADVDEMVEHLKPLI